MVTDPIGVVLSAVMLLGGALLYVVARRSARLVGHTTLSLAAAMAVGRHGDASSALVVGAVGCAIGLVLFLLPALAESPASPLGLSLRLLLAGFAATATLALATGRPLGEGAPIDLNVAWYWCTVLGALLLIGDRDPEAIGLGGALLVGGLALAASQLGERVSAPAAALAVAAVTLAIGGRWLKHDAEVERP
jgi:hypothetical protein